MEINLLHQILLLHKNNIWKDILALKENYDQTSDSCKKEQILDWSKYLWVWPTEENLNFIANAMKAVNLNVVTSVGCGSGLFEWLLQQCTGIDVVGIEIDELWWSSPYAPPKFIPLTFPQHSESLVVDSNSALLFCYFNNGAAFKEYVDSYDGRLLIIIGPGEGRGTHTNPTPFDPAFGQNDNWRLFKAQEINDTKDFIAIYVNVM